MPDRIINGRVVNLLDGHQPNWLYGTFAQRPPQPAIGDTYYATDTKEFDVCYAANVWTAIISGGGGGLTILTISIAAHELVGQVAHGLSHTPSPIGMPNPDSAYGAGAMGSCDATYAYVTLPSAQDVTTTFKMGVS